MEYSPDIIVALIGAWSAIAWVFVTLIGQVIYYYCIEQKKLEKEREFSFRKEKMFKLYEKFEQIQQEILSIDKSTLYSLDHKFSDVYASLTNIESLLNIYFPVVYKTYTFYQDAVSELPENPREDLFGVNPQKQLISDYRDALIKEIKEYIQAEEKKVW